MKFKEQTIKNALARQSNRDGWGSWCARCGALLTYNGKEAAQKPMEQGGTLTSENCVVFCPKCYAQIKSPNKELILFSTIPYYRSAPKDWDQHSLKS